jgi:hypothetical protein
MEKPLRTVKSLPAEGGGSWKHVMEIIGFGNQFSPASREVKTDHFQ